MYANKLVGTNRFVQPLRQLIRSSFRSTSSKMVIEEGDPLPNVDLYEDTPANKVNLSTYTKGKRVVIFAVPGAFTPGCSKTHLPGYVQKAEEIKRHGIDDIICIGVNDPFVMNAWGREHGADGKIRMLADPTGAYTRALDLGQDLQPLGGYRSKRYAMVVTDGLVTSLNVEPDGTGLSCSLADRIKL